MSEENNFEYNKGIYNAYEYNKVDKDGVNDISKRREMEKSYVTGGIVDTEGLAWLDKNEMILTTEQTEDLLKAIKIIKELNIDLSKFDLDNLKLPNLNFSGLNNTNNMKINDVCSRCPNHPINGGSGTCNCTLPYVNGMYKYE